MDRLPASNHHDVAIIGAGFGGIGAAIQLGRHGFEDVVLLESSDDVGGTWRGTSRCPDAATSR